MSKVLTTFGTRPKKTLQSTGAPLVAGVSRVLALGSVAPEQ